MSPTKHNNAKHWIWKANCGWIKKSHSPRDESAVMIRGLELTYYNMQLHIFKNIHSSPNSRLGCRSRTVEIPTPGRTTPWQRGIRTAPPTPPSSTPARWSQTLPTTSSRCQHTRSASTLFSGKGGSHSLDLV